MSEICCHFRVWIATSEQDWELCEQNYAGVQSRGYVPGPLSPVTEGSIAVFHSWYRRALEGRRRSLVAAEAAQPDGR